MNVFPSDERFGIWDTYSQMFFGRTLARPAMISSGFQPWRWKSTMSDCMKTAQPYPNIGMALALKAKSAYSLTSKPKPTQVDCRK